VISVFQKPPNRTPKFTDIHRNTPKEAVGLLLKAALPVAEPASAVVAEVAA